MDNALTALDHICFWLNDPIVQTLVVAFAVIMLKHFRNSESEASLTEEDHSIQTRFLGRAHKPFALNAVPAIWTLRVDNSITNRIK